VPRPDLPIKIPYFRLIHDSMVLIIVKKKKELSPGSSLMLPSSFTLSY
jgi:hypothetical protein